MWKINYDAPKGARMNYGFCWVSVEGMAYCRKCKTWREYQLKGQRPSCEVLSTSAGGVKTRRAFERHLRSHPELEGRSVVLESRYFDPDVSFDIRAEWV